MDCFPFVKLWEFFIYSGHKSFLSENNFEYFFLFCGFPSICMVCFELQFFLDEIKLTFAYLLPLVFSVSYLRNHCIALGLRDLLLDFLLTVYFWVFYLLPLVLWFISSLFLYGMMKMTKFFCIRFSSFLTPFVEKTILFLVNSLGTFVIYQLTILVVWIVSLKKICPSFNLQNLQLWPFWKKVFADVSKLRNLGGPNSNDWWPCKKGRVCKKP